MFPFKSKKKRKKQPQWPADLYLKERSEDESSYKQFRDNWEKSVNAQGYFVFGIHDDPSERYSEVPPFVNIATPPEPFMLRSVRRDAYEKSRARFDQKPKLSAIPERGPKGIAAAGRLPGTLTASEIAEVNSTIESIVVPPGGDALSRPMANGEAVQMKSLRSDRSKETDDTDSTISPPSYRTEDENTRKTKRHRLRMLVIVGICLVVLGIITSGVAIYFSVTAMNVAKAVEYPLSMKLRQRAYTSDFATNTSDAFQLLRKEVCDLMTVIVKVHDTCKLDMCKNGSVIVEFRIGVSKEVRDTYRSEFFGMSYATYLVNIIKRNLRSSNPPDVVRNFVEQNDPDPESVISLLSLRTTLTSVLTTTSSVTNSTVLMTPFTSANPVHVTQGKNESLATALMTEQQLVVTSPTPSTSTTHNLVTSTETPIQMTSSVSTKTREIPHSTTEQVINVTTDGAFSTTTQAPSTSDSNQTTTESVSRQIEEATTNDYLTTRSNTGAPTTVNISQTSLHTISTSEVQNSTVTSLWQSTSGEENTTVFHSTSGEENTTVFHFTPGTENSTLSYMPDTTP